MSVNEEALKTIFHECRQCGICCKEYKKISLLADEVEFIEKMGGHVGVNVSMAEIREKGLEGATKEAKKDGKMYMIHPDDKGCVFFLLGSGDFMKTTTFFTLLFSVLIFSHPVHADNDHTKTYDVIIVGGGIAGLTAAFYLDDYDLLLLEKEQHVGGVASRAQAFAQSFVPRRRAPVDQNELDGSTGVDA